jgi:hypothetical protein
MKRVAPAAERNKQAILEVLREELPRAGVVLEIASGTGQHAVFFAGALPALTWQPSDPNPAAVESIRSYRWDFQLPNLVEPLRLDATDPHWWSGLSADALVCINMIHIAPWQACLGLLDGAARLLPSGAALIFSGPFVIDGDWTSESNVAFDRNLKAEDPSWGVRELRDVEQAALGRGLRLQRVVPRPANNHVVVFRKT